MVDLWRLYLGDDRKLFLLSAGIAFVVMRIWLPETLEKLARFLQSSAVRSFLCAVLVATYLVTLIGSTTYAGYVGHVEPNIAAVSYIFLRGGPLYHGLTATQRYSTFYGPAAYLPFAVALRIFGANILPLKLVVLFANVCLLWLLWRCYRNLLNRQDTFLAITAVIVYLLIVPTYVLQVRGDILIVLCVAVGLFAVTSKSRWISVFLFALACGFSFNIKFTALFYFLALSIVFIRRHGWRLASFTGILAAAIATLPFLLPSVSAAGYLAWLHSASLHPSSRVEIVAVLKVLPFILAPFALLLWTLSRRSQNALATYLHENWLFLMAVGGCLAAVSVSASIIGAGAHHFMPFYPLAGYVCADLYRRIKESPSAKPSPRLSFIYLLWFWLATALVAQVARDFSAPARMVLTHQSRSTAAEVTSDLEKIMHDRPGKSIEMGYGDWNANYELTWFRPLLVFAGNPYTIDTVALADMQLSGLEIPPTTLEYLQQCRTQIWLIPKGDPPFGMLNVFSLMNPRVLSERRLFSDDFRRIFFQYYRKQGSSGYFDIWECESGSPSPTAQK